MTHATPPPARPADLAAVLAGLERLTALQGRLIQQLIKREQQP